MNKLSRMKYRDKMYSENPVCIYCRQYIPKEQSTLDHVLPKRTKYKHYNKPRNFVLSCLTCNLAKGEYVINPYPLRWHARNLWPVTTEAPLFYGSPVQLDVSDSCRSEPVVFATPHIGMALSRTGREWGDRDLFQGRYETGDLFLAEMRPGAMWSVFEGHVGYLYMLSQKWFRKPAQAEAPWWRSKTRIKTVQCRRIKNIVSELQKVGVRLLKYDPKSKEFKVAIAHFAKRARITEARKKDTKHGISL